jgi:hypothetical protein
MSKIDIVAEKIASSLIEEKFVNKQELASKIKMLIKIMYDIKSVEFSSRFKETTLDYVSSVARKNNWKSNFWKNKCEQHLSKAKIKEYYVELGEQLKTQDFSSHRVKKAKQYELKNNGLDDLKKSKKIK